MADKTPQELLSTAIVAARTARQREALAAELERIAAFIRATAQAQRRQQTRPSGERAAPRKATAGPGRRPSRFVRIAREDHGGRERVHLYVGRGLYYDLGSPARLDVQRLAGRVVLSSAAGDAGYAVMVGGGMPRFFADGARDLLADLEDGRYAGEVRAGRIEIGDALTD